MTRPQGWPQSVRVAPTGIRTGTFTHRLTKIGKVKPRGAVRVAGCDAQREHQGLNAQAVGIQRLGGRVKTVDADVRHMGCCAQGIFSMHFLDALNLAGAIRAVMLMVS